MGVPRASLSLSLSLSLSRSRSRSLFTAPGAMAGPDKGAGVADDDPVTDITRVCGMLFPRSRSLSLSGGGGGCKLDIGGALTSGRETQRWGAGGPGTGTGAGIGGPPGAVEGGGRDGAGPGWYCG
jgi:hypothetical protein